MTDYRALCAELIENLEIHCEIDVYSLKLINRARAALAAELDGANNRELLLNKKYKTYEAFIQEVGYDDERDD